jgi:cobalt-zinc-cadmium efflux system protein
MARMEHDHDHHGHAHHHPSPERVTTTFVVAILINLAFVVIEVIYALMANSMSLLADAGHNFGDVLGLAVSGFAMWLLKKQSTNRYSYGFKRTTILSALFNAALLIVTTILIMVESINKLLHPVPVQEHIIIIVAAVGILVNGGTALLFLKGREDLNIKSAFLHLSYDALISFGVVLVGLLLLWKQWLWLDPLVGMMIAIAIFYGTWGLLRQSLDLSLDAVPHYIDAEKVLRYLQQLPSVRDVHHLHIWALSTQEVALTAHLVMPEGQMSDAMLEHIQAELAHEFRIQHITLQVEKGSSGKECKIC